MKALAALLLAGCTLYKGVDMCEQSNAPGAPAVSVRDPSSGQCVFVGPSCNPSCGPCPAIAQVQGPDCFGPCENLDESACLTTATCHAAYADGAAGNGSGTTFLACWDTEPLVAKAGVDCTTLDALGCAAQDDCISLLVPDDTGLPPSFLACASELALDASCAAAVCDPASRCVVRCDANACTPACIPDGPSTPGTCDGIVACVVDPPACPSGTSAGVANGCFTGYCIPASGCAAPAPGACISATCTQAAPACPAGTTPSVTSGCWDGYCIPDGACP